VGQIGVLISGRGSNLQALIDAAGNGELGGQIRVVISNRPDAAGLARASQAGIEAVALPRRKDGTRADYDRELVAALSSRGVTFVCLAGFMLKLGPAFCEAFPNAVLNIHPSLLPAFPGLEAQRQALEHGVRVSGATVHFVTPELDAGPIVAQACVPVRDDDTDATLADRILGVEHQLYPAAVRRVLAGGWRIEGRRVVFDRAS
jgi:phosphoribosylglycinamide formyltransferase-1